MNASLTLATTLRVLRQLQRDRRTVAMMILLPALLIAFMRYVLNSEQQFDVVAPPLLAIFPFIVMFLITSVATLRERSSGTLERLMTMPIGKPDLLVGYALAFGLFAAIEAAFATVVALVVLGLSVAGSLPLVLLIGVLDALLGMALGLFVSAFARTEFQAVQFMPLIAAPQILVCGLFTPRDRMAQGIHWFSDLMPLSYSVDAVNQVSRSPTLDGSLLHDMAVMVGCIVLILALGAITLRRQTA